MKLVGERSTILLRIGVAFAFLYPPFDSLFHPDAWYGFFPPFMTGYFSESVMLTLWGILEVVIALWILSGKKIFLPSLAAVVLLVLIVFFNFSLLEIVFRDIAIALTAATLAWWSFQKPAASV
ncbi:MAG: hypothetical protein ACREGH_01500 [Minisyncoccia bacterium]